MEKKETGKTGGRRNHPKHDGREEKKDASGQQMPAVQCERCGYPIWLSVDATAVVKCGHCGQWNRVR